MSTRNAVLLFGFLHFLTACGETETDTTSGAAGDGGAGGDTTMGGDGGTGGAIPWDGGPILGFGYVDINDDTKEAPFSSIHAFVERTDTGQPAIMTSVPIIAPVDGYIVTVTVAHVVKNVLGGCAPSDRHILISLPTDDRVPMSPGVYEDHLWTTDDVLAAPPYRMTGDTDGDGTDSKALYRPLAKPLEVAAGQVVHIGSLLDSEPVCSLGTDELLDGSQPPAGDAFCAHGDTWSSCRALPWPGDKKWVAYVAWVTFAQK